MPNTALAQPAGAAGLGMAMPMGQTPSFLGINGLNTVQGIQGILGGIQSIGNLWAAFQSAKLAKKQFKFTKDITNTNLANQIKSYNTALTDRITSRAHTQGMSKDEANAYLSAHSLTRKPSGG
jgi:hypothetical protein